jgi:ribonuclease BN (tRNA processing enzyme)
MELLVLGCQAGMPADGWPSSGYLVTTPTSRILLDCGPGVAAALSSHGGGGSLDAIVISHLHPDHCYDLLPVGTSLLRTPRSGAVRLYVPEGGPTLLDDLAKVFPLRSGPGEVPPFHEAFVVIEYRPGDMIHVGDCALRFYGLRHTVANCGVRIQSGSATLAYTGDTGPTGQLLSLARGADLLLAEATLAEPEAGDYGHLCAADAARVAAEAGVGQLVLTHLGSTAEDWVATQQAHAERHFLGPVNVARPGIRFVV